MQETGAGPVPSILLSSYFVLVRTHPQQIIDGGEPQFADHVILVSSKCTSL